MSDHTLELVSEGGELAMRFVCVAAPGAPCRKRPRNPDVDPWSANDPDLVDADDCWAAEWIDAVGIGDGLRWEKGGVIARIPLSISYDEGVVAGRAHERDQEPGGSES